MLVRWELKIDSVEIIHISADGTPETNSDAEKRLMNRLGFVPDMFHDEGQCIEDAYDRHADKIAYVGKAQAAVVEEWYV
jgi:hypothetical protein